MTHGDLNIHVDEENSNGPRKFLELLKSYDLSQHVHVPTHRAGHTLDLVISSENLGVANVSTEWCISPDHYDVLFTTSSVRPDKPKKTVSFRKWRNVDTKQFQSDIEQALDSMPPGEDLDVLVEHYDTSLQAVTDKHAPLHTKSFVI